MGSYPVWWLCVIFAVVIFAQTALGLRLWPWRRAVSIAAIIVLSIAGLAAAGVAITDPNASLPVFGLLAGIHIVYCLALIWLLRASRREAMHTLLAAAYSLGAIGVPLMATRANLASWPQQSASALPVMVTALAIIAFPVGRAAYNRMMDFERRRPTVSRPDLLAITWLISLSMVLAGILSIVAVSGQLGFDVRGGRPYLQLDVTLIYILVGCTGLSILAAAIGWLRRPRNAEDDALRVSATALVLCLVGLAGSVTVLIVDLAINPWGWPIASPYFVVLGIVNALHYLEDIVQTPVRIQCLGGEWPAWLLGILCGLSIAVAVLWLGERVLWGPGRQGASLTVTTKGVGVLALILVAVFAANLVVAFGSGPHQYLTVKSPASNAVQSQLLYGAQLIVTTCIPSIVISMMSRDLLANVKPIVVAGAFAGLLWGVARHSLKNNADHLVSERARPLAERVTRRQTPRERRKLHAEFVQRLSGHIAWQERLSRWTLNASLLRLFVLGFDIAESLKRADDHSPPADGASEAR